MENRKTGEKIRNEAGALTAENNKEHNDSYEIGKEETQSDYIDNVSDIIILGDAIKYDMHDNLEENVEEKTLFYYRHMLDFELPYISDEELSGIRDGILLLRLNQLCPDRLTDEQKKLADSCFVSPDCQIKRLLGIIKKSDDIHLYRTNLSREFDNRYKLSKDEKTEILRSLTPADYVISRRILIEDSPGDTLFEFEYDLVNTELPRMKIYMKINNCLSLNDSVLAISFHELKENERNNRQNRAYDYCGKS